jgi:hypothetical protein
VANGPIKQAVRGTAQPSTAADCDGDGDLNHLIPNTIYPD